MTQRLYSLYLYYDTKNKFDNNVFLELLSFFGESIQKQLRDVPKDEREDLKQECLMIIDDVFKKKRIKMNIKYYYKISDYKKKHLTTIVNWKEYYNEKIIYRNLIGFKIINAYLYTAFNNRKKDLLKKKKPILLLNRQDEKGIEYLEYVQNEETISINIKRILRKYSHSFTNRQWVIINSKLKHFRKKDSKNFRYITTSGS